MKEIMRRVVPLFTFDLPLQYEQIEQLFADVQQSEQQRYSGWSAQATLKKVASLYWYRYVLIHFFLLFGLASLVIMSLTVLKGDALLPSATLIMLPICGLITFLILLLMHYKPFYNGDFLPRLESVASAYESRQLAQLEKCKQAQYSNLALVLIFHVWDKTGNLNSILTIDQLSRLLTKAYGVDNGSIKKNLELLFHKSASLSPRKRKEIEKGFEEAYSFFEGLHFEKGTSLLKNLEMKILGR